MPEKLYGVMISLLITIFIFYTVLSPFQDHLNSYEMDQSVAGAKTGKTP